MSLACVSVCLCVCVGAGTGEKKASKYEYLRPQPCTQTYIGGLDTSGQGREGAESRTCEREILACASAPMSSLV